MRTATYDKDNGSILNQVTTEALFNNPLSRVNAFKGKYWRKWAMKIETHSSAAKTSSNSRMLAFEY
jgi:hypothetical protein